MFFKSSAEIKLPRPILDSRTSVEKALSKRRSIRDYSSGGLSLQDVGQLLWAAQGKTGARYGRTAPSAGALYPLEIYILSGKIPDLPVGVYHYIVNKHSLKKILTEDIRKQIMKAALNQTFIAVAPLVILISAYFSRTRSRYGSRAERYVFMEAGHAAQNIYLQCCSLSLGTCAIGAFYDAEIKKIAGIDADPLYIMPVGHPA